jgi:hypothetical protein
MAKPKENVSERRKLTNHIVQVGAYMNYDSSTRAASISDSSTEMSNDNGLSVHMKSISDLSNVTWCT